MAKTNSVVKMFSKLIRNSVQHPALDEGLLEHNYEYAPTIHQHAGSQLLQNDLTTMASGTIKSAVSRYVYTQFVNWLDDYNNLRR